MGFCNFSDSIGDHMIFKLYTGFAFVAIASAIVSLVRIALGHDAIEAVRPNIVIGSVCLAMMMLLYYRERRQIERKN